MKILSFISTVFALLAGVLVAMPVSAQCPEGKTEILMTTPNGITKVRCVNDKAISGIENSADHAVIEIATSCPCWSEPDFDEGGKYAGYVCSEKKDFSGMECSKQLGDPPVIETGFTDSSGVYYCVAPDSGKLVSTELEYATCDRSLIYVYPYSMCPCIETKSRLLKLFEYYQPVECSQSVKASGIECYVENTTKHVISALSYGDHFSCQVTEDPPNENLTYRQYEGCIGSLESYVTP